MIEKKSSFVVERFCPVVGKNVVMKVYSNKDNKTVCLNDLRCEDMFGGCKNHILGKN